MDDVKSIVAERLSRHAKFFYRVRFALGLSQQQMGKRLGLSSMAVSYFERGYRIPKDEYRLRLRNLAFEMGLPFAVDVYEELDDPETRECPACRALRKKRELKAMNVENHRQRRKAG